MGRLGVLDKYVDNLLRKSTEKRAGKALHGFQPRKKLYDKADLKVLI